MTFQFVDKSKSYCDGVQCRERKECALCLPDNLHKQARREGVFLAQAYRKKKCFIKDRKISRIDLQAINGE